MKSTVKLWLIRIFFIAAAFVFAFQVWGAVQSGAWPASIRNIAMVLASVPLVARPQLVLQPYPLSAADIHSWPRAITLPAVVGAFLLFTSFVLEAIK